MDNRASIVSAYYINGEFFSNSVKTLGDHMELDAEGRPTKLAAVPMYFLASHAAELFLKAALIRRGATEADVRKVGHKLGVLLRRLEDSNVVIGANTVSVVTGLAPHHQSHKLRYDILVDFAIGTYWPALDAVIDALRELRMLAYGIEQRCITLV